MRALAIFFGFACFTAASAALAQTRPTPDFFGSLGLNTVPSARMDETGTVRATGSRLRPFDNATLGVQVAAPFYLAVRQSALGSLQQTRALYPGLDAKLRLQQEGPIAPAIVVGWQSAVGQAHLAGEYVMMSKRYNDFDFSLGAGWGQEGAGSIRIPNGIFNTPHFHRSRPRSGIRPNGIDQWFTGHTFGLLGGVEYDVPRLPGFALKVDVGGDRLSAGDMDARGTVQPWSLGASYSPWRWVSIGAALVGGNTLMTTLSLQTPTGGWPFAAHPDSIAEPVNPARAGDAEPGAMQRAAAAAGIDLFKPMADAHDASAHEDLNDTDVTPLQLGRATRPMTNNAGRMVSELTLTPVHDGLRGPAISLSRDDIEAAMARNAGSPQEIWRNVRFDQGQDAQYNRFLDDRPLWQRFAFHLKLDNQVSLADRDRGLFYYSSAVLGAKRQLGAHVLAGLDVRFNIDDNLKDLESLRPQSINPIRSDIGGFAGKRIGLDRLYSRYQTSLTPNLHVAFTGGYLEQQFGGSGGEVLYRPFGKTWAVGGESYIALKRDYRTQLALGPTGQATLTGFLNGYYEVPVGDLTLGAKVGRYLAGDYGGTLSLDHRLENGVRIGGFATATDRSDVDAFGSGTNIYSGVRLSLPLGGVPLVPRDSNVALTAAPIGRNAGQVLDVPLPLYEETEPLSYRALAEHWTKVTD